MSALTELFTDIADSIRSKTDKTEKLTPSSFAEEIASIESGGFKDAPVLTARCTEALSANDTVVVTATGDTPSYTLKYEIPSSIKVGTSTEIPTLKVSNNIDADFSPTSPNTLFYSKILTTRYTNGGTVMFLKKNESFVQLKVDGTYGYMMETSSLYVDYDKSIDRLFVVDYDQTGATFNIKIYRINEEDENLELEYSTVESFGLSAISNLNTLAMFTSRSHLFIVVSGVGMKFVKYDIENHIFGEIYTYSKTGVTGLRDFVEVGDTNLYISLGVAGLILKYTLNADGIYEQTAKSAGNQNCNVEMGSLNMTGKRTFLGMSTTRYAYYVSESGSTITLTQNNDLKGLTGNNFVFTKDKGHIWRFGSSLVAGNTALYKLNSDESVTLIVTPGSEFSPAVATGSYGAYIYGRPQYASSTEILCRTTGGALGVYAPFYANGEYTVKKAEGKLVDYSTAYGYGISKAAAASGTDVDVSVGFVK